MWHTYHSPRSIDEALPLLAEHAGRARIIAGGTDLILELERKVRPDVDTLIDITRIPGLDQIEVQDGWVRMGPLVTHNHCAGSKPLQRSAFALSKACWQVGAPQIRNRGTVAGNLITASPANDSITPLMAFGAQVRLASTTGQRVVPLTDFFTGVRKTVMRDDELMLEISFPLPPEGAHSGFYKLGLRKAQAVSLVNVAILVELEGKVVQRAAVTLGAVAPTVIHASEAEAFLVGKSLSEEIIERAGELAAEASRPIDDIRATAGYRKAMTRVVTLRTLRAIREGSEREGYPGDPVMLWGPEEYHVVRHLTSATEHKAGIPIETVVNGRRYSIDTGQHKTLLRFLREDIGLTGTKEGCAEGECGACTVFLDGSAVMACLVPAPRAHGAEIMTIEGLAQDGHLHPIQQAFIDEGAVQCGYCTPGFLMSGAKLLEEKPEPTRDQAAHAVAGNLCRCTGYYKILTAIEKAARMSEVQISG
jgi:xanthine dehydrogenase iron-sulfur cluster and FAD-binding subunit A